MALQSLGKMVRGQRADRGIREVAEEIGVSASTLSRVERGKLPDLITFQKICSWLKVDPNRFLDLPDVTRTAAVTTAPGVAVHFRADRALSIDAASDLAKLILAAYQEAVHEQG